jgi:hypothetical protein
MMSTLLRAIKERPYVYLKYFNKFIQKMASVIHKLQREEFADFRYCSMDCGGFNIKLYIESD